MGKPGHGHDNKGKKLSWTYRNKKKRLGKPSNFENDDNVQVQNKKGRIIVRNLSFKVTEADVRQLYEPFGEIEEINLLRRPDGKPVGCGFVQFKRVVDASKAIFNTHKKEFLGRPINSDWAISKDKYYEKVKTDVEQKQENKDEAHVEEENKGKQEDGAKGSGSSRPEKKKFNQNKAEQRKLKRLQKRKKRARIVVRNLSFEATEQNLKEHFSQYGNIEDIRILTKPDGTNVGCAFIQFELVQNAAKAIHYSNSKPLLEREIIVDWAVPKSKFGAPLEVKHQDIDITEEKEGQEEAEDELSAVEVKEEVISDEEKAVKDESESEDDEKSVKSEDDEDEDEEEQEEQKNIVKEEESKPRWVSNDVSEGRTVFLKNVPFQAKDEDLKDCMEQFGPVFYALVCVDPLTEHSKGTAFVKFRNVEDAEKCLSAGTELRLFDQVLDPHLALHKNEIEDQKNFKSEKIKDSRNLFLVKEGVILARHSAAVGVSAQDIEKRLQLERWKSQMLRNLNMFVSRVRLVVHNLPPTLDDAKLRQLCKNHSGPNAVITEARVMRNLRKPDANGVGESKEYGFVTFTMHEDALKALRSLNNNPNIFTKNKRPIVAFSIENRVMVNAKQKRITKSREHNPLWTGSKDRKEEPPIKQTRTEKSGGFENSVESHQGVTSNPKQVKGKPTFKVEKQEGLYKTLLKNQKRDKKTAKIMREKKMREAMSRKEIKPKQGKRKSNPDDENFAKLVNSYKQKLLSVPNMKSKWYDT
ncbi:RNA-binding protein 28-like [Belonocnema kinseyi]|uniref:RNA-binding protein 28-like n=1 Tax=Belonocnema kinseyi TaxID=2817044 RepID=UPI00143DD12F|nr:RNA-binding protein 28-like [Belonocnema kinseyi]